MTHALQSEWIDAAKFEVLYSLSRRTFFLWIADGRLPVYRPSRRKTLVKRSDVEKILEASKASADLDQIVEEVVSEFGAGK
jgi:excisionase family DNA binding protein